MADKSTDQSMEDVETNAPTGVVDKGKGKAPEAMEESAEDDSSDESGPEEPADEGTISSITLIRRKFILTAIVEPEDEDNMEEIDTGNIVGRRTRGKQIDFAEAAKNMDDEEDEDDDDDFNDPDDAMEE
ncbi:hypothetical protein EJ04DRAFT_524027 [Polyplosphaeria fusca]|uniref:Histone chaperone domain-containing protein n=1 Tax=Polyplosphaeria fusca TaxID=682080 RepID=A0A9P4V297_9PLEO|nr:hypothetical protein EJ04DRAFT_524027 [Polyplosphaeria fusca]